MIVARHPEGLGDALKLHRRLEHHAVGKLVHHGALDLLPRRLAGRILEAAGDPASDLCKEVCAMLDDPNADAKKRDEKLAQVTPYFAHANVVKCSICRLGNAQAPDQMYRNCESYLEGELPVLKPDIVVTQGRHAARALEEQFVHSAFDPYNHRLRYLTLNENKPKDVLWIQAFTRAMASFVLKEVQSGETSLPLLGIS